MVPSLNPMSDRLLIEIINQEEVTESGIFIPNDSDDMPRSGIVIASGPGRLDTNGHLLPMSVKVGDEVYFGKYAGVKWGDDYIMVLESEVLAIAKKDK